MPWLDVLSGGRSHNEKVIFQGLSLIACNFFQSIFYPTDFGTEIYDLLIGCVKINQKSSGTQGMGAQTLGTESQNFNRHHDSCTDHEFF